MVDRINEILHILPTRIRGLLVEAGIDFETLQEIRMRVNQPVIFVHRNEEKVGWDSCTKEEIRECMEYISRYSMYAFEEEMKQGFITVFGGHRIGIAGEAVIHNGKVQNIKNISFLNIRIAHQIKGCADPVMEYIVKNDKVLSTLIVSPPGGGKTTLLRDMIRQISNGGDSFTGKSVGVVDERSELGACYRGVPQNDLGIRTDVLDCCPKAEGMLMLIRSMSPEVIAVDEVGGKEDVEAMEYAGNCGCVLLATAHGRSMEEIKIKPGLMSLITKGEFRRYIILGKGEKADFVCKILDEQERLLYKE